MTRRRSSAPGARPARRLLPLVLLFATALVAACGSSGPTPTGTSADPTVPAATDEPTTAAPSQAPPTEEPPPTFEPGPSASSEPFPSEAAASEPPDDPTLGAAAACTGTDENRDFYADVAAAVAWPVYCPSLPRGWFVESGQYRLAGGGRVEITYRGPNGSGLRLQQGAFCEGDACIPAGSEMGPARFGDREGTLYAVDGGWAVVTNDDGDARWLVTITGVGESRARAFAEDLVRLD